jgi:hypothetical protein
VPEPVLGDKNRRSRSSSIETLGHIRRDNFVGVTVDQQQLGMHR